MPVTLRELKKHAKNLSNLLPVHAEVKPSLMQCQEIVAAMHGFPDWHSAVTKTKPTAATVPWARFLEVTQKTRTPSFTFSLLPKYPDDAYKQLLTPGWLPEKQGFRAVNFNFLSPKVQGARLCREAYAYMDFGDTEPDTFLQAVRRLIDTDVSREEFCAKSIHTHTRHGIDVGVTKFSDTEAGGYVLKFHGVSLRISRSNFESVISKLERAAFTDWAPSHERNCDPLYRQKIRELVLHDLLGKAVVSFSIDKTCLVDFLTQAKRLMTTAAIKGPEPRCVTALIEKGIPVDMTRFMACAAHPEFYVLDFCGVELHYSPEAFKAAIADLSAVLPELSKLVPAEDDISQAKAILAWREATQN